MVQTSVQFTPTQVLQAARRAEAEGKMDYALQFYRHLVEQHGHSPEAQEAREGLFRIAEWRWGEARLARGREEAATGQGPAAATPPPTPGNQRVVNVVGGQRTAAAEPPPQQQSPTADPGRLPQIIAREHEGRGKPAFQARFRAARVFAHTLSGFGWLTLLTGIVGAALAIAGTLAEVSAAGLFGLPMGIVVGVPGALLGLLLVVTGQVAAALFESSNATLELAAIERGRA
jgi:hypothetical protein